MSVTLLVVGGSQDGRRIPLTMPEFLIGRDSSCHLRPASKDVGQRQCAIVVKEQAVFLRDDSNGQGTYLNRRLLAGGELQLQHDDLIEVGPLSFRLAIAAGAKTPPPRPKVAEMSHILTQMVADLERKSAATMAVYKPGQGVPDRSVQDSKEILCSS